MPSAGRGFVLSVDARHLGAQVVVRLDGELDFETAPQVEDCLRTHQGDDVVVDLEGLTFMDSMGISLLLNAFRRSRQAGHTFVLRGPTAPVTRVLEITGVDQVLTIEPGGAA
jgi:anti-sigma B factor antagonist